MDAQSFNAENLPNEVKISKGAHQLYNKKMGELTVLYPYKKEGNPKIFWVCKCSCGKYCGIASTQLTKKENPTQSCGCLRKKNIRSKYQVVKEGMNIASLTTIKQIDDLNWLVECKWCKKQYSVTAHYLNSLIAKNVTICSCGCQRGELISKKKIKDLSGMKFGWLQVIDFSGEIINHNAIWNCRCDCGKNISCLSRELIHDRKKSCGCRKENISKDARKIFDFLTEEKITFLTEYSFDDLISENKIPLRFDFAIFLNSKIILLIEVQGRQHYMPVDIFGGEEEFLKRQRYDSKKREYCTKNNIPLLELSYKEIPKMNKEDFFRRIRSYYGKENN